jgi:hypothetical protein
LLSPQWRSVPWPTAQPLSEVDVGQVDAKGAEKEIRRLMQRRCQRRQHLATRHHLALLVFRERVVRHTIPDRIREFAQRELCHGAGLPEAMGEYLINLAHGVDKFRLIEPYTSIRRPSKKPLSGLLPCLVCGGLAKLAL